MRIKTEEELLAAGPLFVICTIITELGDEDCLVIESWNEIDDSCVALTDPMIWDEVVALWDKMRLEREIERTRARIAKLEE